MKTEKQIGPSERTKERPRLALHICELIRWAPTTTLTEYTDAGLYTRAVLLEASLKLSNRKAQLTTVQCNRVPHSRNSPPSTAQRPVSDSDLAGGNILMPYCLDQQLHISKNGGK